MTQILEGAFINVYSELNDWMDCIVHVSEDNKDRAKEICDRAFDSFFDDDNEEPYGDVLDRALTVADIPHEIYYE